MTSEELRESGHDYRVMEGRYLVNTTAGKLFFMAKDQRKAFQLTDLAPAGSVLSYILEVDGRIYFNRNLSFDFHHVGPFQKFDLEKI